MDRRSRYRRASDSAWRFRPRSINEVGLMDPVFGRGYSEEIDWCLRSHTMGYKSVLAPSCFVYHAGSGITKVEGLVGDGDKTVHAHQAIIDQRYPLYTSQLIALVGLEHHRRHARARATADHHLGSTPAGIPTRDESAAPAAWRPRRRPIPDRS